MPTERDERSDAGTQRPLTIQEHAIEMARAQVTQARNALELASQHLDNAAGISPNTDNRRKVKKTAKKKSR